MDTTPHVFILGMGYLMTYLKPCYHHLFGENLIRSAKQSQNMVLYLETD